MEKVYRNFFRKCYLRTGHFIPVKPLNQCVFPGDFFQVRNGEMITLGNIFRNNIIDPAFVEFGYGIALNPSSWHFSDAVKKPYSGRGTGEGPISGEFEFSKQVLSFAESGSFFFTGNNPESVKILNWKDIQQQLIIKLTQTCYSFRDVFVVTETATMSSWTLAIAGASNAELEIATDTSNFGLVDIFGHESAKTIQSKDIEYYHRENKRRPAFFKAQKLQVQDEKVEVFISDLIMQKHGQYDWANGFFDCGFQLDNDFSSDMPPCAETGILDLLQAGQLNPNTALNYFKWTEANLDDIEKLFLTYGDN